MDRDEQLIDNGSRCDDSTDNPVCDRQAKPALLSRVLVTWIELTIVGITGGLLGVTVGGPLGFIISLITTLLTVGVIFYNVNELIKTWTQMTISNTRVEEEESVQQTRKE
jgi:FtsH-binding integral membrane protein